VLYWNRRRATGDTGAPAVLGLFNSVERVAMQPTVKRAIAPVTITVKLVASRVNENGTFSGFTIESVKGPNSSTKAVCPPQGGGSIYLKVETLEGITFLTEGAVQAAGPKKKLF